MIRIAANSA